MSDNNIDTEILEEDPQEEQSQEQQSQEQQQQQEEEEDQLSPVTEDDDINDILVIKGKFKFNSSGIYGIFAILFRSDIDYQTFYNTKENPFISLNIVVSYFSDIFQVDLKENWSTLENQFNDLVINGDFASSITSNFHRGFLNAISNEELAFEMVADYKKNKKHVIQQEIDRIFSQTHKDRALDLELFYEEASGQSIDSVRKIRIDLEAPLPNEDILSTPATKTNSTDFSIPASPILAPVGEGIPSNQISRGVRILMRVNGTSSYGQHWIKHFHLYDHNTKTHIPLVGTVDQIGPVVKNCLDIVVKYQDNQYTKFNVESGVKLKTFNPNGSDIYIDPLVSISEQVQAQVKTLGQLLEDEGFRLLMIVGAGMMFVALIALYFVS